MMESVDTEPLGHFPSRFSPGVEMGAEMVVGGVEVSCTMSELACTTSVVPGGGGGVHTIFSPFLSVTISLSISAQKSVPDMSMIMSILDSAGEKLGRACVLCPILLQLASTPVSLMNMQTHWSHVKYEGCCLIASELHPMIQKQIIKIKLIMKLMI
jgi:hypothetical protein